MIMINTQNELILNHLKQGYIVTPVSALHLFGCFRLAARINNLRAYTPIESEMIKLPNGKRVAKYWIA